jgi:hypothetical protein
MIASWSVSFPKQAKKIADKVSDRWEIAGIPQLGDLPQTLAPKKGSCKKDTWVLQSII